MPSPLLPSTVRRLQAISQGPVIWEFVRRPAPENLHFHGHDGKNQDLILIGDCSDHILRGFEPVDASAGQEAIVRAIVKAIERPELPLKPQRPVKLICPDRTTQMFLRGALQDLGIKIDFAPHMTIVDDFFEELARAPAPPNRMPPKWDVYLSAIVRDLWNLATWDEVEEYQAIKIDVNRYGVESLWACTLGSVAMDPAIAFFRSEKAAKQLFVPGAAVTDQPLEQMHGLDCLAVLFPDGFHHQGNGIPTPVFASIHPMEGFRDCLDEEECRLIWFAISAYLNFMQKHQSHMAGGLNPVITANFNLSPPFDTWGSGANVNVSTSPELMEELQIAARVSGIHSTHRSSYQGQDCINLSARESNLLMGSLPARFLEALDLEGHRTSQLRQALGFLPMLPFIALRMGEEDAETLADGLEAHRDGVDLTIVRGVSPEADHTANLLVAVRPNHPPTILWQGPPGLPAQGALDLWTEDLDASTGQCLLLVAHGNPHKQKSLISAREVVMAALANFRTEAAAGASSLQHMIEEPSQRGDPDPDPT